LGLADFLAFFFDLDFLTHRPFLLLANLFLHLTVLVADLFVAAGLEAGGETLPTPTNVELAGAPNIVGCGEGAGLHESPVSQGDGWTGAGAKQLDDPVHSRAS
jgi:hypothetical protein